jgi:hypothetical protein
MPGRSYFHPRKRLIEKGARSELLYARGGIVINGEPKVIPVPFVVQIPSATEVPRRLHWECDSIRLVGRRLTYYFRPHTFSGLRILIDAADQRLCAHTSTCDWCATKRGDARLLKNKYTKYVGLRANQRAVRDTFGGGDLTRHADGPRRRTDGAISHDIGSRAQPLYGAAPACRMLLISPIERV